MGVGRKWGERSGYSFPGLLPSWVADWQNAVLWKATVPVRWPSPAAFLSLVPLWLRVLTVLHSCQFQVTSHLLLVSPYPVPLHCKQSLHETTLKDSMCFSICFLLAPLKRGPAPKGSMQERRPSKAGHQWCASVGQIKGEGAGGRASRGPSEAPWKSCDKTKRLSTPARLRGLKAIFWKYLSSRDFPTLSFQHPLPPTLTPPCVPTTEGPESG